MTDKKDEREPNKPNFTLDLGLGGIFKNLGDMLNVIADLTDKAQAAQAEVSRSAEFEVKGMGDQARGVYGFTIRSGIGGPPRIQPFGNIRKTEDGPVVSDVREPLVDIFDEGAEILIVAELPGVSATQIQVDLKDDILSITTTGERRYTKEILLSAAVDPDSLQQTYTNGILELRLRKV